MGWNFRLRFNRVTSHASTTSASLALLLLQSQFFLSITMASNSETPYTSAGADLPLMIHVTAPATLPAGYTFEAEINGDPAKLCTVEVPAGGVEEGQVFLAPLSKNYDGPRLQGPTGHWKDGIFDCFNAGYCHPSFWCSLCCTQLAMGQVMSRLQLTWLGHPGPLNKTRQTFTVVVMLVASFFVYSSALEIASMPYPIGEGPMVFPILKFVGNLLFTVWAIYSLCKTRQTVRERFQIPEKHCAGCEDFCCAAFCGCCAVAQMMRHTGEYENYAGVCCNATGHPPGTPLVV